MGGTIGICTDCLKEATKDIAEYTEPIKVVREDAPLFPHPELNVTISSVADEEPKLVEVIDGTEDATISVAEDTVTETVNKPKATTNTAKHKTTNHNKGKKK